MTESLYNRLGGESGISTLVDRIVDQHLANPKVATRFEHGDITRARAMGKEFFAAGSGGPNPYTGKDMPEAHAGMNISDEEFLAVVDDMMAAMDELGHGQREKDEVLAIAYSLKDGIIRV
jgi:hemoglobin